jgi:hypothetical protein
MLKRLIRTEPRLCRFYFSFFRLFDDSFRVRGKLTGKRASVAFIFFLQRRTSKERKEKFHETRVIERALVFFCSQFPRFENLLRK